MSRYFHVVFCQQRKTIVDHTKTEIAKLAQTLLIGIWILIIHFDILVFGVKEEVVV